MEWNGACRTRLRRSTRGGIHLLFAQRQSFFLFPSYPLFFPRGDNCSSCFPSVFSSRSGTPGRFFSSSTARHLAGWEKSGYGHERGSSPASVFVAFCCLTASFLSPTYGREMVANRRKTINVKSAKKLRGPEIQPRFSFPTSSYFSPLFPPHPHGRESNSNAPYSKFYEFQPHAIPANV